MTTLEQIIDTWFINHRTNLMLIGELTQEALDYTTSKRGGGTIGHQLAHIYNVRFWKLEKYDSRSPGRGTKEKCDHKRISTRRGSTARLLHFTRSTPPGKHLIDTENLRF
jgi:hypothetical protein